MARLEKVKYKVQSVMYYCKRAGFMDSQPGQQATASQNVEKVDYYSVSGILTINILRLKVQGQKATCYELTHCEGISFVSKVLGNYLINRI